MATSKRGKSKSSSRKPNDYGGYSFVNVSLSKDDKAWLASADCATEFPLERLLDLVSEGYKVSLRYDGKNNTYIASLADTSPESPTYKSILSGRGSTTLNAWYALLYRHFILLSENWGTATGEEGGSDFN